MRKKEERKVGLNSNKAAEYVDLAPETMSRMRSQGRGPRFVVDGGIVRYHPDILDAWLKGDPDAKVQLNTSAPEMKRR